jgi:hypothetical protein
LGSSAPKKRQIGGSVPVAFPASTLIETGRGGFLRLHRLGGEQRQGGKNAG